MLSLMNRLLMGTILMDAAGDGGGGGGGEPGSLLAPSGSGSPAPAGGGTGDPGAAPNPQGKGAGDPGTGNPSGGNTPPDWRSALPKELQEDGSLKRYKSVADLAGAYVNAQKLISGDKMAVPNKNWTDADWKNFYTKAGVPEDATKYEVKFDEKAGVQEDFAKQFKENAHKLGILPKQAQALADWFGTITVDSQAKYLSERTNEFNTGVQALKAEWGNAFDGRIAQGNRLIGETGMHDHFKKMGYGSDPILMKMLGNLAAEKYKDPKINDGGGAGNTTARTPQEIDAAIARMQMDPAYTSAAHPGHKAAVDEMAALHQEKFPPKR